jgi:hypothetical protein
MAEVLERLKSQKNEHGESLFDHLLKIVDKLSQPSKHNATSFDAFEVLSEFIRQNSFLYNHLKPEEAVY